MHEVNVLKYTQRQTAKIEEIFVYLFVCVEKEVHFPSCVDFFLKKLFFLVVNDDLFMDLCDDLGIFFVGFLGR